MLEAFFRRAELTATAAAPFPNLAAQVAWAESVVATAKPSSRDIYCCVMADIKALASDLGAHCLRETLAVRRPNRAEQFSALKSDYDRGIWVWLNEPTVFAEASARWFFERRRPAGAWADTFPIAPDARLDADLGGLRAALETVLEQFGTPSPAIAFESYELTGRQGGAAVLLSIAYEGRLISKSRIRRGKLHPLSERVVHYAAVLIENRGLMYVVSENRSAKLRAALAQAVMRHGLGLTEKIERLPPRHYNLQRLLDPAPFSSDPAHNIESACVSSLTIKVESLGAAVYRTHSNSDDVRTAVLEHLKPSDRMTARVLAGQLRVVFGPRPGRRRPRVVRIDFRPTSVSMDWDRAEEDLLRAVYFESWRLLMPPRTARTRA